MKLQDKAVMAPILLIFFLFGCVHSQPLKEKNETIFYNYDKLSSKLAVLQQNFPDIITQQVIGRTYEGREILTVQITGNNPNKSSKPGILAIFAEHGAEHDMTVLAIGFIEYLAENYGKNKKVTDLLTEKVIYFVPMMNPDGVDFDLSGKVKPFTWRKNRRPVGDGEYGVDLNRNWGLKWNIPISDKLAIDLSAEGSPNYAGPSPFSEKETTAVKDFLSSRPNIKIIVDYHSGGGGFMQGMVIYPGPFLQKDNLSHYYEQRYEEVAENFAKEMSNENDQRPGLFVNKNQNVALQMRGYFPWYIRPFIPKNIPYPPGTSSEWTFGHMRIMSFGVELTRDTKFFKNLEENLDVLIETQTKGFLFLLETVSEDPFRSL